MLGTGLRIMFRGHLTTSQICLRCIFFMAGLGQCIVHDLEEFQPLALTHTFASAAPRSSSSRHPPIIHLFHCSSSTAVGPSPACAMPLARLRLQYVASSVCIYHFILSVYHHLHPGSISISSNTCWQSRAAVGINRQGIAMD
jgi:hypothetical protein